MTDLLVIEPPPEKNSTEVFKDQINSLNEKYLKRYIICSGDDTFNLLCNQLQITNHNLTDYNIKKTDGIINEEKWIIYRVWRHNWGRYQDKNNELKHQLKFINDECIEEPVPISWRVLINDKYWDYKKFIKNYNETKNIYQTKGHKHMVTLPKKNDIVYYILKQQIIMKGIIDNETFIQGDLHKNDQCIIDKSKFNDLDEYIICKITEIYNSPYKRVKHVGQNTWCRINLDTYIQSDLETNILIPQQPEENITLPQQPEENITLPQQPEENITLPQQPEENITLPQQLEENLEEIHYIYLIHIREWYTQNKNIFKFGRTSQSADHRIYRLESYPKKSKIILLIECNDSLLIENKIKKEIKKNKDKFKKHDDGYEHIICDKNDIIDLIIKVVRENN